MRTFAASCFSLGLIASAALAADLSPLFQVGKPSLHSFSTWAAGYGALGEDQSHVAVYVSPKDAVLIRAGMPAKVRLGPPEGLTVSVDGKVTSILADADPRTRQAIVSIVIPEQSMAPRTYANALIPTRMLAALSVPSTAIVVSGGKTYVYKKDNTGDFEQTEVHVGEQGPEFTEIRSGLRDTDDILIQGALEWAARDQMKGGD